MGGKGQEKGKSPAQDGKSLAAASAGGAAEMAASDGAGPSGSWRDREPPPPFDGRDPSRSFPRWLKELKLGEFETEIPKNKRGVKVLRQLSGAARSTADNLSFEEIACEKGLDNLLAALEEHFKPHLETSLPKAFEEAIYGDIRGSKETFGEFVIRMEYAFKELERQGVKLHDMVIGYVMFRHANLNDVQESQMLTWGEGKFDRAVVVRNLRRLDKGGLWLRIKMCDVPCGNRRTAGATILQAAIRQAAKEVEASKARAKGKEKAVSPWASRTATT